jgi:hypothetical protein
MRFLIKVLFLIVFVSEGFCATWEHTYGRNQGDIPRAFLSTTDGGYLLTGGTEPRQNNTGFRVWVLKVGSLGKIQWQKTFGAGIGESIVATSDDGYLIAASSQGAIRIFKINKFGNVLWQKTIDRPDSSDAAIKLQPALEGGYILAAYTNFSAELSDIWIIRLDSEGNVIWQYTYGGPTFDVPSTIKETPDGGWIVVGYTRLGGSDTIRGWVFKLKSAGEIEWQKAFGRNGETYAMDAAITHDGGFAITGMAFDGDSTNAFLIRLSSTGNIIWQKMYGGAGFEQAVALQTTPENHFVLSGDSGSFGEGSNAFILSLNQQGEILWQNIYGTIDGRSLFLAINNTKDSGYIAFDDISDSTTGQNFWLLKLDHFANLQNNCGIQEPIQMETTSANFKTYQTDRKPIARKYVIRTPHVRITNTDGFENSVCEK